jgi:hypothetical protein
LGIKLSPEERRKCCQIIKPGTILTWFRRLAARKYDSSGCKTGRPRKARDIRKLVVKMALENLGWRYTKIRDALRTGLKIEIGRTAVADILAEVGPTNDNGAAGKIVRRSRLGGMLNYYSREAA